MAVDTYTQKQKMSGLVNIIKFLEFISADPFSRYQGGQTEMVWKGQNWLCLYLNVKTDTLKPAQDNVSKCSADLHFVAKEKHLIASLPLRCSRWSRMKNFQMIGHILHFFACFPAERVLSYAQGSMLCDALKSFYLVCFFLVVHDPFYDFALVWQWLVRWTFTADNY